MFLGLASDSAKSIQHQAIHKKRKTHPPRNWDGISYAYDQMTRKCAGWTHRFNISSVQFSISSGVFADSFNPSSQLLYGADQFYEHTFDNRLHTVMSICRTPLYFPASVNIQTVVYAHIATYASRNVDAQELYRSVDLSLFFNTRAWSLVKSHGISTINIVSSASINRHINGDQVKNIDPDDPDSKDLRIFVVLDDLSEHTFRIGDLVKF